MTRQQRGHTTGRTQEGASLDAVGAGRLSSHLVVDPIAEGQSTVPRLNANRGEYLFYLRRLKYGSLPEDANYVAVVAEKCLRLYDTKSTLSEAAVAAILLSKILKVQHGSDECLMLILMMSHCHQRPYTNIYLELQSREDKEILLSIMLEAGQGVSKVQKEEHVHFILFTLAKD